MASNYPPKKNVAFTMYFFVYKNDGTIIANPTLTGSNVHTDGGTTEVTNSTLAVVDATTGLCSIALAQGTMNGDQIDGTVTSSSTGAVVYSFKLMTTANTQDEIVAGTVKQKVDVETIKTQAVTCAAGVTVLAQVGAAGAPGANNGLVTTNGTVVNQTVGLTAGQSIAVSDKTGFSLSSTGADLILKSSTFIQAIVAAVDEFATYGLTALKALIDKVPKNDGAETFNATCVGNIKAGLSTQAELDKVPKLDGSASWNATALAAINAEVDTALNTAIPGSPTADSINERIVAIDAFGAPPAVGAIADAVCDEALSGHSTAGTVGKAVSDVLAFGAPPTAAANADAVWDEAIAGHAAAGSAGAALSAATAPSAASVADAVWDEALSGHSGAGTAGLALATASSGGVDPSVLADAIWDEALSGHATGGTAGKTLADAATAAALATVDGIVDNIHDTDLPAVKTDTAAILADTGTDGVVLPQAQADKVWGTAARVLTAGTNIALAKGSGVTGFNDLAAADVRTAVGLASANLDTQLAALPTDADVNAACDTAISDAALATATNLATVDTVADAIKLKTDNLPASPAAVGSNMGTVSSVTGAVGSVTAGVSVAVGGIDSTSFAAGAVDAAAIAANAIGSAEVADGAITAAKIANAAIDQATFAADVYVVANVKKINDTTLTGNGSTTPWGPA